jgi:hypothetical protein
MLTKDMEIINMYTAYFVNVIEGWLCRISDPKDNPIGKWEGWKQITEGEYALYVIIQNAEYPS